MAVKVSGAAALQKLQPINDGTSQALQFWGSQDANRRKDIDSANEREGVRKDQAVAKWEEYYKVKAEDFASKYTGFKSYDDMNSDFSLYMTDQYIEKAREARDAMTRGDLKGKSAAESELMRYKLMFKEASKSQSHFEGVYKNFQKAASEGKVSGASKEFESTMQAIVKDKNVAMRMKDGNLVYVGMDKDGKTFEVPSQDIMDESFSWFNKQDLNSDKGIIKSITNNLGKVSKDVITGYTKTTTQGWDEQLHGNAARASIKAAISSNEAMSDILFQVTKGEVVKRKDFTEEDYKTVEDGLYEMVKAGYDEVEKKDFDSGKYSADKSNALGWAKLNEQKKQNAINNAKPKEFTSDEQLYGARKYNIQQVKDKGVVSFFNSGTFKWQGEELVSKGSYMLDGNIVVKTDSGLIKVDPKNEIAVNQLFNSFDSKDMPFEKVQNPNVRPYAYSDFEPSAPNTIGDFVGDQFKDGGKFSGSEESMRTSIKEVYPDAEVEVHPYSRGKRVTVNGVKVVLGGRSLQEVSKDLNEILGKKQPEVSQASKSKAAEMIARAKALTNK